MLESAPLSANPYEVIIVGSGAGGAAAGHRLALAGVRVLIVEKGGELPADGSTLDDIQVVMHGRFLSKEPWRDGSGRAICPEEHFNLGGKTRWYGAAVLRYSAQEFLDDSGYAARGWPITQAELAPYYDEAERLLAVRTFAVEPSLERILGAINALDSAWISIPLPMALSERILQNPLEARHFDGFASVSNLKGDAESSFLNPVAGRANLTVRTGSEVVALLDGASGGAPRVGGVRLAGGEELRAETVMLAAGTLHSPRLLNRFIAALDAPARDGKYDLVGRNLKKHLLTALIAVSLRRPTDTLRKTMLTTHAKFPHSSVQPLGFDAELIATLVPRYVPRFLARMIGRHAYGFFLQTEDGASRDNRVYEQSQTPVMDYDEARVPASLAEHRAFTRAFRRVLLRIGMVSFTQRVGLNGTAHVSGTLVMGTHADHAVVDPEGAVFGIGGLYVVDGSVLPRSSRVNPSLSIYAWGLRVADRWARSRRGQAQPVPPTVSPSTRKVGWPTPTGTD
jgi:choline dehydrogenase-like flavoprotein